MIAPSQPMKISTPTKPPAKPLENSMKPTNGTWISFVLIMNHYSNSFLPRITLILKIFLILVVEVLRKKLKERGLNRLGVCLTLRMILARLNSSKFGKKTLGVLIKWKGGKESVHVFLIVSFFHSIACKNTSSFILPILHFRGISFPRQLRDPEN